MSNETIERVLVKCGYDAEPTSENLVECFLDYVGAGYFSNLDYDEAYELIFSGGIREEDMIKALSK